MIDLTAGAEDWGPAGATAGGLRTRHSMPSLEDFFPAEDGGAAVRRQLLGRGQGIPMEDVQEEARRRAASARRSESMKQAQG